MTGHTTISAEEARRAVVDAVREIVPDADFETLDEEEPLRDAFELDSLDFLSFVELIVTRTGHPVDETDYPSLRSMHSCVTFLTTP